MTGCIKKSDVLDNLRDSEYLTGPTRVLEIRPSDNTVLLIGLRALESKITTSERAAREKELDPEDPTSQAGKKSNRMKDYLPGPYRWDYKKLETALDKQIYRANLGKSLSLPDADWVAAQPNERAKEKIRKTIVRRDARYKAIAPLVLLDPSKKDGPTYTPAQLLSDPSFPARKLARALELGKTKATINHWLHLFWAGGEVLNALCTGFDRVGNPGQEKPQFNPLGRKPRLTEGKHSTRQPFQLSKAQKIHFALGYRLISHGSTAWDAYLDYSNVYFADHVQGPDGKLVPELWSLSERPSYTQFMRWGAKSSGKKVKEIRDGYVKTEQLRSRGGAILDRVSAAGSRAGFDGTSTDLYLVSVLDRLKRLTPATRLVLRESRLGLILGWYVGWRAPSPATALQAIFMGASSKVAYFARFGITVRDEQFANILCRQIDADNGELKAQDVTEAERQFQFQIQYKRKGRGDDKGDIESGHHSDHKAVDHKTPGTTKGKKRTRGDPHPADDALYNYYEHMRDFLLYVIFHNFEEEVPRLRPTDMLLQDPSIKPTRINIFNWMRNHEMCNDIACDPEDMRAYMLPTVAASIDKSGLHLLVKISGRDTSLTALPYINTDPSALEMMSLSKRTNKVLEVKVHMDEQDLSAVWLSTTEGLQKWDCKVKETTLLQKFTLSEYMSRIAAETMTRDLAAEELQSTQGKEVHRRKTVTANAKAERDRALASLEKKPSKAALNRGTRQNGAEEQQILDRQERAHLKASTNVTTKPDAAAAKMPRWDMPLVPPGRPRPMSADDMAML